MKKLLICWYDGTDEEIKYDYEHYLACKWLEGKELDFIVVDETEDLNLKRREISAIKRALATSTMDKEAANKLGITPRTLVYKKQIHNLNGDYHALKNQ